MAIMMVVKFGLATMNPLHDFVGWYDAITEDDVQYHQLD